MTIEKKVLIVGASAKTDRYSYKAVRGFLDRGDYIVIPVHPSGISVADCETLKEISDVAGPVDVVTMYVNPSLGLKMLPEITALQPKLLILNPGADSDELEAEAKAAGLHAVRACTLVALSYGDPLNVL